MSAPARDTPRARRFDPGRRERIVEAAFAVIAAHGVTGTTSRRVAAAADVPLGSITYHFASQEDLLTAVWRSVAERMSAAYEAHFRSVTGRAAFVDAVTALVHDDAGGSPQDWSVTYELYLAALREPVLREITESWMAGSRRILQRFVDPVTARGLDALVEGLVMHKILSTRPVPRRQTRDLVDRAVGDRFLSPTDILTATPTATPTATNARTS